METKIEHFKDRETKIDHLNFRRQNEICRKVRGPK